MTDYWVDDGGDDSDGTVTGKWAGAKVSLASLVSAVAGALTTSGNRIFIGDDHNEPNVVAHKTYTGPTSGLPVVFISADRTDTAAVPAYKVGTGAQLSSLGGAYDLTLDGSFAAYGVRTASGKHTYLTADIDEAMYLQGCTFALATAGTLSPIGATAGSTVLKNCIVDVSSSASSTAVLTFSANGYTVIDGMTFVNATNRSGVVITTGGVSALVRASGLDLSGFDNAGPCEIIGVGSGNDRMELTNCKTVASPTYFTGTPGTGGLYVLTNVAGSDDPSLLRVTAGQGAISSSTAIYRSSGASVEDIANVGWLITTTATCGETNPLHTPWIYGTISSTGAKTFDLYTVNDTADLTDAEMWLEVEYLATSDSARWSLATDQRATITTTAAAQTDDTTSTWNGAGPSYTYKQKLSVPATIGETGQYRARVVVGKASVTDLRVDPKVTVS